MSAIASTATRTRRIDIEALRVICIFGVIVIHTTGGSIASGVADGYGPSYWIALAVNGFSRFAVPLYFAIAGWALLAREPSEDEGAWWRRRLTRLALPLLVWSVIYLLSDLARSLLVGPPPWTPTDFGHWLTIKLQILFLGPGVKGHLWFMYFLIPMTIVIWLIQVAPRLRPEPPQPNQPSLVRAYVLTAVGALVMYALIVGLKLPVRWTGFPWTVVYGVIGYVVLSRGSASGVKAGLALYVAASIAIVALGHVIGYNTWPYVNQGPTVALATVGLLLAGAGLAALERRPAWRRATVALGRLTFGVYLAHFIVVDWLNFGLLRLGDGVPLPGPIKLGTLIVGTAVLTFAMVAAWHRSRRLASILG